MCLPRLRVPDSLKWRDGAHWDVFSGIARSSRSERQADVSYEVWRPEHRRYMRDRHALVRRQCPEELVRRDVVNMNEPRGRAREEHGSGQGNDHRRDRLSA